MAFGVHDGELMAAVVGGLKCAHNLRAGGLGAMPDGLGVLDDDVAAAGFDIAQFGG